MPSKLMSICVYMRLICDNQPENHIQIRVLSEDFFLGGRNMGWCGVDCYKGIDLSEYPCEYARALPVQKFYFLWGETYSGLPPPIKPCR